MRSSACAWSAASEGRRTTSLFLQQPHRSTRQHCFRPVHHPRSRWSKPACRSRSSVQLIEDAPISVSTIHGTDVHCTALGVEDAGQEPLAPVRRSARTARRSRAHRLRRRRATAHLAMPRDCRRGHRSPSSAGTIDRSSASRPAERRRNVIVAVHGAASTAPVVGVLDRASRKPRTPREPPPTRYSPAADGRRRG